MGLHPVRRIDERVCRRRPVVWPARAGAHAAPAFRLGEALALGGEPAQQRRRLQRLVAGLRAPARSSRSTMTSSPTRVGPMHRSAAPGRPVVAVEPDHIDVARPRRDAFLQDARALVDHRVEQPRQDLVRREAAPRHALLLRNPRDQRLDLRVALPAARALRIEIIAAPGLLAEPAGLADRIRHGGRLAARLARAPADVVAGEIGHGEGPHLEAEAGQRRIDLMGQRACDQQPLGGTRALLEHAVADEAEAVADHDRHLAEPCAPAPPPSTTTSSATPAGRTISSSFMTLAGLKKCMPSTSCGPLRRRGDGGDVEIGGVAGQDRAGLGDACRARRRSAA